LSVIAIPYSLIARSGSTTRRADASLRSVTIGSRLELHMGSAKAKGNHLRRGSFAIGEVRAMR